MISYVVESFPGADLPLFSSVDSSSAIVIGCNVYFNVLVSWVLGVYIFIFLLDSIFFNSSSRFSSLDINSYC